MAEVLKGRIKFGASCQEDLKELVNKFIEVFPEIAKLSVLYYEDSVGYPFIAELRW